MSALRFHHVFFLLMLLALVSAFMLPLERSAKLTPQVQALFAPVSKPAGALGRMIDVRIKPNAVDPRSSDAIALENEALRVTNASLIAQIEELNELNRDRAKLGDVRKQSRTYAVTSNDAGMRDGIQISGLTMEGVEVNQPVIFIGGLVGRIVQAGALGAKVKLITAADAQPLAGTFGRFQKGEDGRQEFIHLRLATAAVPIRGAGNNALVLNTLTMKQAEAVQIGDWFVLADNSWPPSVQGYKIGQVAAKEPRPDSPLYAKITVKPSMELKRLTEVNVVMK